MQTLLPGKQQKKGKIIAMWRFGFICLFLRLKCGSDWLLKTPISTNRKFSITKDCQHVEHFDY